MSKGNENKIRNKGKIPADIKSINGKRQDEDKGNRKQTYKKISNSFHVENAENENENLHEERQRRNEPFIPFGTQQ